MEIGHQYQNGNNHEPRIHVADDNTVMHWRVNFGTEKALKNAKIVFTMPTEVQGK